MAVYLVLAAYFAILAGIGVVASRRIRDLDDFYVGGKKLGYWVVAFSARATGESAWLLLGLTGLGAMVGLSALWVVVGEVLGVGIAWFVMADRFKHQTDECRAVTVPDYLVAKHAPRKSDPNHKRIRVLAAGILVLFITIYVSAQIDATGKAFESFLGWNYYSGITAGFGIVLLYTMFGGFVAVSWSDLFQGTIMLVGLVAIPVFAVMSIPSDVALSTSIGASNPELLTLTGAGGLTFQNVWIIVSYLAVGLGFLGSPQVFVRFMSLKDPREIKKGRWVAITYTILTDTAAVLAGFLGRFILVPGGQNPESILGNAAEGVLPAIVEHLFPVVIVGIFVAAVLAAIMSTIDSLLVVASSAVTRDYYQQLVHPETPGSELTGMSRWVTLGIAVFALVIAVSVSLLSPDRTVFWFVIFGWSGIASCFCPVIILTLFWKEYNARGVIWTMIGGLISVPLFKFGASALPIVGEAFNALGEMAPSFVVAFIAGYVGSNWKS
ncbi:MAG: sodium/proline symporter [Rhodothermales bacterium]|nr:sodium/proline symporter [Rhodothermales bacterium]